MIHQLWIVWYPIVGIVWSLSKVTLLLNGEEHDINGSQLQELGDGHLYFPLEFTNTYSTWSFPLIIKLTPI
jgi:hypothetical protein